LVLRRRRSEVVSTRPPHLAISAAAVFVAVVAWAAPGSRPVLDPAAPLFWTMTAFALFVALADLLEVPLERERAFSLGLAPAVGYALFRECAAGGTATDCQSWIAPTVGEALLVFAVGSCLALGMRWLIHKRFNPILIGARLLVVTAAAVAYRAVSELTDAFSFGPAHMSAVGLGVVLVLVCGFEIALQSLLEADRPSGLRRLAREKLRETGPLLLSTVSVAALLALAYPVLGAWTIPIFLAPLGATQFSFRQVATVRRNSLQTVRALARVPEMAGYTQRGHSARVATLAVQIAEELGVVQPELHDVEYAALLHDIGRISLPDPEESGATSRLELALVGAEIVEGTGHFARVAKMIGSQHEPYRRRGEDTNRTLPLGAKIIKVASAYDDYTEPAGPGRTAWDALERLHHEMAYDYDPQVIQALTRVLEKRGLV
jgi:putative nucleotidyltransferase with HDIG domain